VPREQHDREDRERDGADDHRRRDAAEREEVTGDAGRNCGHQEEVGPTPAHPGVQKMRGHDQAGDDRHQADGGV
jgi:hypothetical protein